MLEDQSIQKIIQNIKSSQLSIKELMEYYLNRIEKYNTNLNAIILLKDKETLICLVWMKKLKECLRQCNLKIIQWKHLSKM